MLDHLGEVIGTPTGAYRAGLVSKLLEVGMMLVAAAWAGAAILALRPRSGGATLARHHRVGAGARGNPIRAARRRWW